MATRCSRWGVGVSLLFVAVLTLSVVLTLGGESASATRLSAAVRPEEPPQAVPAPTPPPGTTADCDEDDDAIPGNASFLDCKGTVAPPCSLASPGVLGLLCETEGVKDNFEATLILGGIGMGVTCSGLIAATLLVATAGLDAFLGPACIAAAITVVSATIATIIDPPDIHFDEVALPRPLAVRAPSLSRICGGLAAGSCAGLLRDARAYLASAARTASVSEAIAITANRFQTARRSGSEGADGMRLQATVIKVYFGFLADALDAQAKAGKALGADLRRAGSDVRLSAAEMRKAVPALRQLKGFPPAVVSRIEALGLSRAQIGNVVVKGAGGHGYDLAAVLAGGAPTGSFRELSRSPSTLSNIAQVVRALEYQGLISKRLDAALNNDLLLALQGCSPGSYAAVMKRFMAKAGGVRGEAGALLRGVAAPLLVARPRPGDKPPVAKIDFLIGGGRAPVTVTLDSSSSADPLDGGDVWCQNWDFGDPASGAANKSFDLQASHTYSRPGTYTVTLFAIDDDGYAVGKTTAQVIVKP